MITKAITGWERTAGRFDPTVHDAVIAAGYPGGPTGSRSGMSQPSPGCAGIRIDHDAPIIEFPDGVRFDPGGIGKGLAADLVTAQLLNAGASGALVSLGGDLRVRGESPRGGAWTVDLAEPHVAPSRIARLVLSDGAVATSTTERRRWTTIDGAHRHHLIDPVTGRPHDRSIRFASVITRDGWWAEACAKQLFVVPPCEVDNCLIDAEGIVVDADMVTHRSAGFERFER